MPRAGEKPSQVSGPGKYAKRTDKGGPAQPVRVPTGGEYGDNQEMRNLQGSAPMSASARTDMPSALDGAMPSGPEAVPFGAPSMRPDEPVTAGNPMGPGVGPDAMGLVPDATPDREKLQRWLPMLKNLAAKDESSDLLRRFVRKVEGMSA